MYVFIHYKCNLNWKRIEFNQSEGNNKQKIKFLRTFCCQLKKTVFSQKEVRLNMFSASAKFSISDLIGTHRLPSNGWSYKVNCRGLCHASKLALIQPLSTTLDGTVQTAVSRAFLHSNSAVIKLAHITWSITWRFGCWVTAAHAQHSEFRPSERTKKENSSSRETYLDNLSNCL